MKKLIALLCGLLVSSTALASPSDLFLKDGAYYGMFDDFLGAAPDIVENGGTTTYRTWVYDDVSAAGTPTFALVADAAGGVMDLKLAANNEAETLAIFWNDEEQIDVDDKPVIVVRAKIVTADITTAESFVVGFVGAYNAAPGTAAESAFIHFNASMIPTIEVDDGSIDTSQPSQTTFVKDTWYEFMVDVTSKTDVKFYYRATLGGSWTELTDASSTTFSFGTYADSLQPIVYLYKSTGTTTPEVYVDYIRVWAER